MTTNSIILVILSIITAGGLSFFQYLYKTKTNSKLNLFLFVLRFFSLLGIFILLINPIISTKTFEIIKPPLAIVVDNSSSINYLKGISSTQNCFKALIEKKELQNKYNLQCFSFDKECQSTTQFDFTGNQTNFESIYKILKNTNRNKTYPTILISDGNQTTGNDYAYNFDNSNKIFPLVVGDTAKVLDLKINQINANKYAFLKNKFPVEILLNYSGQKNIQGELIISQGKTIFSKQSITFSSNKNSQIVNIILPAEKVGLQIFTASIKSKEKEKNIFNNVKYFAVDIINQRTNIAIISSISHPDISSLKRAIEANEQRKVIILKPNEPITANNYSVLICYQPNTSFKNIFEQSKLAGVNKFIITGKHTDFNFLNAQQDSFNFRMSTIKEDYLGGFNADFNLFSTENIGFENFPPLENPIGTITVNKTSTNTLLAAKIRNFDAKAPLLSFIEEEGKRTAYLFGENSWKWRLKSYTDHNSYEKYDLFIDKTIQFLASNDSKKSLVVTHENFYNSGESITFLAQYFNKNYEFDEKARLTIEIQNVKTKQTKNYDLLKSNNTYKINLDGLVAGKYAFTVKELNSKTSYSNKFEILNFDIEKQFVNANVDKLNLLATQTNGKLFFPKQINELIKQLINNTEYKTIQKSIIKRSPIIDWYWLLFLIVCFLSLEWFVRKYNGLT